MPDAKKRYLTQPGKGTRDAVKAVDLEVKKRSEEVFILKRALETERHVLRDNDNMVKRIRCMVDALELRDEEGRDKLRKAGGRSTYPVIPG